VCRSNDYPLLLKIISSSSSACGPKFINYFLGETFEESAQSLPSTTGKKTTQKKRHINHVFDDDDDDEHNRYW